jgi:predicted small lipoprotein YifL
MQVLRLITAAALLLMLAGCGSDDASGPAPAPEAAKTKISKSDADAIRAEIYPLWQPPADPPCHEQLKIRIDIAEDGRVVRADAKPELGYDDPCRGAQDAAIRAIWAASPLNVPRNREWDSLTLIFDRDALM